METDNNTRFSKSSELKPDNNEEIDLVKLFLLFWRERKIIIFSIIVFFVIGIIKIITTQEEYVSEVKLIPESRQQSSLGGLTGIARQFGVNNVSRGDDDILPARYYPDIVSSLPFIMPLLDYDVFVPEAGIKLSVFDYFMQYQGRSDFSVFIRRYTVQLPQTIIGLFSKSSQDLPVEVSLDYSVIPENNQTNNNQVINLSGREWSVVRRLQNRIQVDVGRETGIVRIQVQMPDPLIAAEIADKVTSLLSEYIADYRTEKARVDHEFIQERHNEARARFDLAQERLARFRDENRGELTALASIQEQRLLSEYELAFSLYNAVSGRLEESRIKVQEETPLIRILEPAAVPNTSSEPNVSLTIILFLFLGIITGFVLIFARLLVNKIKTSVSK